MQDTINSEKLINKTMCRWTTSIELWHLACSNYRQCYRVLLFVDNGSFYINSQCFKLGWTLVCLISR